ncbi:rab-GTPase-TBC domain-containing protein [Spinellus fusiger]|nr:rab-GTPase-TBC domain-containing protein [Spinellus fusiger]
MDSLAFDNRKDTKGDMAWDPLRREARQLENEIEFKLQSLSKAGMTHPSHHDKQNEQTIETLLSNLQDIISAMQAFLDKPSATPTNPSMTHMLERHKDILYDSTKEFRRVKAQIKSAQDKHELLSQVQDEIRSFNAHQGDQNDYYLTERNRVESTHRMTDSLLEQAYTTRQDLSRQGRTLHQVNAHVTGVLGYVPGINTIISRIHTRRKRDTLIMAAMASKLAIAYEKRQPRLVSSKSTPFQSRHSMAPTPTRTPSLTVKRRPPKQSDVVFLPRLEEENAKLPFQDSVDFILAQIERQNTMLDEDPKSVCIQSNELKAHLSTLQNLVTTVDTESDIDWEFWSAMTEDFSAVALKLPHLVSAKLRAGIPPKVRGVIWQAMCQSASLHLETMYGQLVAEPSPYERIIQRDLARTFPHVDMFKQEGGDGQQALERVLKAYSLYDAMVGYCQGLAFLVGPLLMNMPEQQAFCVFVRIMETYEMRSMFTLNMEGLQLRLYQFSALLAQILPELSDHLLAHAVHAPMYASQWFLTLFAYAFPIELVFRIYDIVFAEGAAETFMRVAIAMMQRAMPTLLKMTEFEDLLDHVTTKLYVIYNDDSSLVISDAMALSGVITKEKMDHLAELYVRELEQEKKQTEQVLAVRFNFWSKQSTRKKESTKTLDKRASSSSSTFSQEHEQEEEGKSPQQDVAMLHQQIEDLLLALSQLQQEHLQVKQELVQVRMDKMDIEAERDHLVLSTPTQPLLKLQQALKKAHHTQELLAEENKQLRQENDTGRDAQTQLVHKLMDSQSKLEALEDVQEDNVQLRQRLKDADKVAHELQLEKIRLLTTLEHAQSQQSPSHPESHSESPSTRSSLASSDSDCCRALEQLLAEAKLRIVELETSPSGKSPTTASSPLIRQRSTQPSSVTGSVTGVHGPTSPVLPRRSYDQPSPPPSLSKRTSFYGRFWSFHHDTPPTSPL